MNHLDEESLNEYFDGELEAGRLQEVEAHLAACESCRLALQELEGLGRSLASLRSLAPARDLLPGVVAALPRPPLPLGWKLALAFQGVAVVGLAVAGLPLLSDRLQPQEWVGMAAAQALRLTSLLPAFDLPDISTLPLPRLPLSPLGLALLATAGLLLGGVGNLILLSNRKGGRQ